jgi:hypothetical protein
MDTLKMFPVKDDDEVYKINRDIPEPLQKPPFVYVYLGSRGVGKTNSLISEMLRKNMYGDIKGKPKVFQDIIVMSSTLGSDSTSRHLIKKATATYDTYDDSIVNDILEFQKSKDKKDRKHILIIADDIAPMMTSRDNALFKLTSVHRHYLISICYLIQQPRMIPPVVRNCATAYHIYRCPNSCEQEKIFMDLSFMGDKKMVQKMYDYATNKPYQFLWVDCIKNSAWKWGACDPEFLWEKYNADGGYSPPFELPSNKQEELELEKEEVMED